MPCKQRSSNYDGGDCIDCLVDAKESYEASLTANELQHQWLKSHIRDLTSQGRQMHLAVQLTQIQVNELEKLMEVQEEVVFALDEDIARGRHEEEKKNREEQRFTEYPWENPEAFWSLHVDDTPEDSTANADQESKGTKPSELRRFTKKFLRRN